MGPGVKIVTYPTIVEREDGKRSGHFVLLCFREFIHGVESIKYQRTRQFLSLEGPLESYKYCAIAFGRRHGQSWELEQVPLTIY